MSCLFHVVGEVVDRFIAEIDLVSQHFMAVVVRTRPLEHLCGELLDLPDDGDHVFGSLVFRK